MTDILTELEGILDISVIGTPQDSSVQIGWCLNKQLVSELAELKAPNPMLLISVVSMHEHAPEYSSETMRYLVPLDLGKAFVSFSRAGLNRVMATIVWDKAGDIRALKRTFLERSGSGYRRRLHAYEYDGFLGLEPQTDERHETHPAFDRLDVRVPDHLFAKEPPQWWSLFQQKLFRSKPFDQCHSRKRFLMVGWWAVPLHLLLFLPLRSGYIGLRLLFGMTGTRLKPLLHPFANEIQDLGDSDSRSIWFKDEDGDTRPFWQRIMSPPVQLGLFLGFFALSSMPKRWLKEGENITGPVLGWAWWECLLAVVLAQIALALAIAVLFLVFLGSRWMWVRFVPDWLFDKWERREHLREAERRRLEEATKEARLLAIRGQRHLNSLVCNTDGPTRLRDTTQLPVSRRLQLWFGEAKHKVCKPYQK